MANALQIEFLAAGVTDNNGDPLNGGKVYTYAAGTTTPKTCWTEADKSQAATNPIILNTRGQANVYAEGNYKFVIKDANDNIIITLDDMYYIVLTEAEISVKSISANYTLTTDHNVILINASSGNIILTLYSASGEYREIVVKRIDSTSNTVTIDAYGSETIDGAASITLDKQYSAAHLLATGSNWHIVTDLPDIPGHPPTATPTANRVPIADANGKLFSWITDLPTLDFSAATELTISSGAITLTQSHHRVDTESEAASDDLDTINGMSAGQVFILKAENDDRTVTLKHNTGNIWIPTKKDIVLDDVKDSVLLYSPDGSTAIVLMGWFPFISDAVVSDAVLGDYAEGITDEEENTMSGSYVLLKKQKIGRNGAYRIKFDLKIENASWVAYGKIYRNGSPVGTEQTNGTTTYVTKSEDISGWTEDDTCELWVKTNNVAWKAFIKCFRVCSANPVGVAPYFEDH